MVYFLIAILLLIILILAVGLYLAVSLAYIRKRPDIPLENYESPYLDKEYSEKVREWLDTSDRRYEYIYSPYYYKINAMIAEGKDTKKWIILLHGVTNSHKYMIDIASFYHKAGYSVLAWDSRGHGKTGGKTTTYGYYEKFDLKAVIDYIRKTYGDDCRIGLHGISMGSGILLMYASHVRDDCDFYIADCPYSNFPEQVMDVSSRKLRVGGFLIKTIFEAGNIFLRILYKFDARKVNIISKIRRVENPILFFNCRDDAYINPRMTEELYEAVSSEKKYIERFDDGGHAGAFFDHPDAYEKRTLEFLKEINF